MQGDAQHHGDDGQPPPFLFAQQHAVAEHDQCARHHEAQGLQDEGGHDQDDHAQEHLGLKEGHAVLAEGGGGELGIALVLPDDKNKLKEIVEATTESLKG